NVNGPDVARIQFQVKDDGGTANGGVDTDQSPNTLTINVTSINDPPSGTTAPVTTLEDTVYTFQQTNFGFSDTNDSPANAFQSVSLVVPATGTLKLGSTTQTAGATISVAASAVNTLTY